MMEHASAALLDHRRLRAAAIVLFSIEIALFAVFVAGTHGWIVPLDKPTTTDFVSFYAAGLLADSGTPALAYDHAAHLLAEERVTAPGIGYQFFNYPPVFLLLCALLARLPYLASFILFESATLVLYLFVATRIVGQRSGTVLVVLLAFPVVYWNFGLGQNAFLTAGLFGAATLLIDRRPVLAGLLFGALCYKPQFGLMVPLALVAGARWRALAAAAGSAAALVFVSLALFGAETWRAFLLTASASPEMYGSGRILFAGMSNVFGGMRLIGGGVTLGWAAQAAASLVAAGLVILVWRRGLSLRTRGAALAAATLLAAPLALLYDLMLGCIAGAWLLRERAAGTSSSAEAAALAVLFLLPLPGHWFADAWHVPIFPLSAIGLFALTAARAARELAVTHAGLKVEGYSRALL